MLVFYKRTGVRFPVGGCGGDGLVSEEARRLLSGCARTLLGRNFVPGWESRRTCLGNGSYLLGNFLYLLGNLGFVGRWERCGGVGCGGVHRRNVRFPVAGVATLQKSNLAAM